MAQLTLPPDHAAVTRHIEAALNFPPLLPKEVVQRALSPRIAVVSSPEVDDICQRSRLKSFADLLLPFGDLIEGKVTTRHSSGLSYTLDNFYVRFTSLADLEAPDPAKVSWITLKAAQRRIYGKQNSRTDMIRDAHDVTQAYRNIPIDELTPWYRDFRNLYLEYTGAMDHDSFDHPVACLIAVSSLQEDAIEQLAQLYDAQRPPLFDKGFVDPKIFKYYVVVHDCQLADLEKSIQLLERVKKQFGPNCYLLKLGASIGEDLAGDIWTPYQARKWLLENAVPVRSMTSTRTMSESSIMTSSLRSSVASGTDIPGNIPERSSSSNRSSIISSGMDPTTSIVDWDLPKSPGSPTPFDGVEELQPAPLIAEADVIALRQMVRELVVSSLIPDMERSIQYWNDQVASARRGVAGRLFSAGRRLFGHQGKTNSITQSPSQRGSGDFSNLDNTVMYNFASSEMQMRRLADFSLMLGDYRYALSVYEMLKRDFTVEKAWKYAAGAYEMIGLCELLLGNGERYDAEAHLEQVVSYYAQRAKCGECATRAAILHYELFRHTNLYHEAAHSLVKSTDESSNLKCALFLEQAAYSFARSTPPKVRKYAFILVLAGHRYARESLVDHASRCYRQAEAVFESKDWRGVENHIYLSMGRQLYARQDLIPSLSYMVKLLRETDQSPAAQQTYLREFYLVYKHYYSKLNKNPLIEGDITLPIPVIDDQQVNITLPNFQTQHDETDDDVWQEMEQAFAGKEGDSPTTMDQRRPTCAVGETVLVNLEMYNPMQVELQLSGIVLECVHDAAVPRPGEDVEDSCALSIRTTSSTSTLTPNTQFFTLDTIAELTLKPHDRRHISLKLTPLHEGTIHIIGIHYTLNGVVGGYHKFEKRGRRLNSTKAERMQQLYAPDHSLELLVTPPMPLLDVMVYDFPDTMLSGEISQATLVITNGGDRGLRDLGVAISHPSMLYVGSPSLLNMSAYRVDWENAESPDGQDPKKTFELQTVDNTLNEPSFVNIPFGDAATDDKQQLLAPGASIRLPLWIRADRASRYTFRLLFHYRSEESKYKTRSRTSRYTLELQVLPSLRIHAFTRASTRSLNEYILGMEIESLQGNTELYITQVALTNPKWRIEPITVTNEPPKPLELLPRQMLYAYYRVSLIEPVSGGDAATSDARNPDKFTRQCMEKIDREGEHAIDKLQAPPISVATSRVVFEEPGARFAVEPITPFFCSLLRQWRRSALSATYGGLFDRFPNAFTLFSANEAALAVFWRTGNHRRLGHYHVLGVNLSGSSNRDADAGSSTPGTSLSRRSSIISKRRSILSMRAASAAKRHSTVSMASRVMLNADDPVKVLVQSPSKIIHDFKQNGICLMDMTISIKNCTSGKIEYTLELDEAEEAFAQRPEPGAPITKSDASTTRFDWIGITHLTGVLQSEQEYTAHVRACFSQPGVYNLNRWRMSVVVITPMSNPNHEGGPMVMDRTTFSETPTMPHYVMIVNKTMSAGQKTK